MYATNLGYLPEVGFRLFPEKAVVYQDDLELTYAQLEDRANRVANALLDSGLDTGDTVALLFSNDWRYLEALLGTMRAGAVAVPVNTRLAYASMRHVLDDSRARVVMATHDMRDVAEQLLTDCPRLELRVCADSEPKPGCAYEDWLSSSSGVRPPVVTEPADLCMVPYTSGSTGRPKGVLLHHGGQLHNADAVRRAYMLTWHGRTLAPVPLYHVNAMSGSLFPFVLAGGSVVILSSFTPAAVLTAIERYRCNHVTGVPAMYSLLLREREAIPSHDVSSLEFLSCGSAPLARGLLREVERAFNVDVVQGYGLTEGGPIVTKDPRWGVRKPGSCGIPLPDVEVRLVEDDGKTEIVEAGLAGELWVRSPGIARGYANLPEATGERFTDDGWLKTGDVMRFDEEGFYYFVARKDDMINVGGESIYPADVETIVLRHAGVRDVCVVAAPHEIKGEVPVAYVVPLARRGVTEDEIRQFCLSEGPAYAHPRRVFVIDELPLSSTGKVDRKALTDRYRVDMNKETASKNVESRVPRAG